MSLVSHLKNFFLQTQVVRDLIIGLSDGLTVPLALAAGLNTLNIKLIIAAAGLQLSSVFLGFAEV